MHLQLAVRSCNTKEFWECSSVYPVCYLLMDSSVSAPALAHARRDKQWAGHNLNTGRHGFVWCGWCAVLGYLVIASHSIYLIHV